MMYRTTILRTRRTRRCTVAMLRAFPSIRWQGRHLDAPGPDVVENLEKDRGPITIHIRSPGRGKIPTRTIIRMLSPVPGGKSSKENIDILDKTYTRSYRS